MSKMTIVLNESPTFFPREVQLEGETYPVLSCSMSNSFDEIDRAHYLLKKLIWDHDINIETLNEIGFSDEDASNLSMSIDGLKHAKPPKWENN